MGSVSAEKKAWSFVKVICDHLVTNCYHAFATFSTQKPWSSIDPYLHFARGKALFEKLS